VAVADRPPTGTGHPRWATDGTINECNRCPHGDESGRVRIVLNGIIGNRLQLCLDRVAEGLPLSPETDRRSLEMVGVRVPLVKPLVRGT
jgi:glucosamine 6-phosphate synthetase-like amidotransferase/phosphosugar isomerase protein